MVLNKDDYDFKAHFPPRGSVNCGYKNLAITPPRRPAANNHNTTMMEEGPVDVREGFHSLGGHLLLLFPPRALPLQYAGPLVRLSR